jgi:hypothetical protein
MEMEEVSMIYAYPKYVICPYCSGQVCGWVGNPTGQVTTCDECGKIFKVSEHADVEID